MRPFPFSFMHKATSTPAPTLSTATVTEGDIDGNYTITLTGTNFVIGATTVAFGPNAGTSVSVSSSTSLTVTVPAHATGSVNLTVTTAGGTSSPPLTFTYFSPAQLSATAWLRGSYAGSPWVGTASAGGSGSQNLSGATAPTAGTLLNGYSPAAFNGSTQSLSNSSGTFVSTSAYFVWALVYVGSIATSDQVNAFNNDAVFMDSNGTFGMALSSNKVVGGGNCVQFYHFDGAAHITEVALSTGAYALLQVRYDGTTVHCKVNNGTAQTMSASSITSLSGVINVGSNYSMAHFLNGRIMELGFEASAESDARFDDVRAYVNTRYGLSL